MTQRIGPEGQITISQEIRDQLGIGPGWEVVQQVVDGHVELYFSSPEQNGSLKGVLAKYTDVVIPEDQWHEAREKAWEEAMRDKYGDPPRLSAE